MAMALLSPLSVEEKLVFLAKFTATISGSAKSSGVSASSGAEKVGKPGRGKKAAASSEVDTDASSTSSSKKREATPQFKANLAERNAKIKELRAADPSMPYHDAMREAAIVLSMEKDGLTRAQAEEKQAASKAKRSGGAAAPAAPAAAKTTPAAPKTKSAPKSNAAAAAATSLLASASAEDLEEAEEISTPAVAAPSTKKSSLATKLAAKKKKEEEEKKEAAYELVEGEDMETATAMKDMGCERMLVDGDFVYVNQKTNEAYDLEGELVGVYDKEGDCIQVADE